MSAWGSALVIVAVLVGALVQGSIGFGLNLIAAPVLALVDPDLVPGP
ncbi:MAG: sulfite exporter TauE/SafE family protein, partial [Actinomycetota bacterium]|nr:sulfite exporter TauE/SafE family protein [Actinomycetota bacterium]